jgi:uncharacterized membrane protein YsdA (DUF1294 family)
VLHATLGPPGTVSLAEFCKHKVEEKDFELVLVESIGIVLSLDS